MFDHLIESSHRDDSNKWSNIGFGQEKKELASIEIHFTHLIWRSEHYSDIAKTPLIFYTCIPFYIFKLVNDVICATSDLGL